MSSAAFAQSLEGKVIGYSQIGSESGWRAAETAVTRQEAEARGVDLRFADASRSRRIESRQIRGFIAQGVNGILVAPVVGTGWEDLLTEAKEAEIPVVLLDRGVDAPETSTSPRWRLTKSRKVAWLANGRSMKSVMKSAASSSSRAQSAQPRQSTARRASKKPLLPTTTLPSCAARPVILPAPSAIAGQANATVELTPNMAGPAFDALAPYMADGAEPEKFIITESKLYTAEDDPQGEYECRKDLGY